jgi:hypothetical protein
VSAFDSETGFSVVLQMTPAVIAEILDDKRRALLCQETSRKYGIFRQIFAHFRRMEYNLPLILRF